MPIGPICVTGRCFHRSHERTIRRVRAFSAPARRDGRNWPGRPETRSKYTRSLPNQGISRPPVYLTHQRTVAPQGRYGVCSARTRGGDRCPGLSGHCTTGARQVRAPSAAADEPGVRGFGGHERGFAGAIRCGQARRRSVRAGCPGAACRGGQRVPRRKLSEIADIFRRDDHRKDSMMPSSLPWAPYPVQSRVPNLSRFPRCTPKVFATETFPKLIDH
jgi:hypothetical protein